jgi:hypothetical protein
MNFLADEGVDFPVVQRLRSRSWRKAHPYFYGCDARYGPGSAKSNLKTHNTCARAGRATMRQLSRLLALVTEKLCLKNPMISRRDSGSAEVTPKSPRAMRLGKTVSVRIRQKYDRLTESVIKMPFALSDSSDLDLLSFAFPMRLAPYAVSLSFTSTSDLFPASPASA